jgi:hypothetical protein
MASLHHICDECSSEFTLKYDEEQVEDSPHFCAFCGEMMVDFDENYEDEDE